MREQRFTRTADKQQVAELRRTPACPEAIVSATEKLGFYRGTRKYNARIESCPAVKF